MSHTWKDLPYRAAAMKALAAGYVDMPRVRLLHPRPEWLADVDGYEYSRHNHRIHVPLRRMHDWRWIEGDWGTGYGNERRIRQLLKLAAIEANNKLMDDDWDDPLVYRRRREWHLGD